MNYIFISFWVVVGDHYEVSRSTNNFHLAISITGVIFIFYKVLIKNVLNIFIVKCFVFFICRFCNSIITNDMLKKIVLLTLPWIAFAYSTFTSEIVEIHHIRQQFYLHILLFKADHGFKKTQSFQIQRYNVLKVKMYILQMNYPVQK